MQALTLKWLESDHSSTSSPPAPFPSHQTFSIRHSHQDQGLKKKILNSKAPHAFKRIKLGAKEKMRMGGPVPRESDIKKTLFNGSLLCSLRFLLNSELASYQFLFDLSVFDFELKRNLLLFSRTARGSDHFSSATWIAIYLSLKSKTKERECQKETCNPVKDEMRSNLIIVKC